jgi:hypothetical protein
MRPTSRRIFDAVPLPARTAWVVVLAVTGIGRTAHAEEQREQFETVALSVTGSCGADFERELRLRVHSVSIVERAPRRIYVDFQTTDEGVHGTLRTEGFDDPTRDSVGPAQRELAGATCDEVVRGLALAAASAIDGSSEHERARSQRGSAEAPNVRRWSVGVGAEASTVLSDGAFGLGVQLERAIDVFRIRGGVAASTGASVHSANSGGTVSARFAWVVAPVDACYLGWHVAGTVRAGPCAGAALGVILGSGADEGLATRSASHNLGWADLRAHLRVELVPWASVEGGVVVPLTRETFAFSPGIFVYRAPPACAFARLSLAVPF